MSYIEVEVDLSDYEDDKYCLVELSEKLNINYKTLWKTEKNKLKEIV